VESTQATPDQIQAWKAKYGEDLIREIEVVIAESEFDEKGALTKPEEWGQYIVRIPGRTEVEVMAQHMVNKDITKHNAVLVSNCVLHGDMDLLNRDARVFSGVVSELGKLVAVRKTRVKKL
jgi:hypothetical protein